MRSAWVAASALASRWCAYAIPRASAVLRLHSWAPAFDGRITSATKRPVAKMPAAHQKPVV